MQKRTLNYRFHNPNPAEKTAAVLIKLFVEVNHPKVEDAMRQAREDAYADAPEPVLSAHT